MPIDHSRTYRDLSLRNLPHLLRARAIAREIRKRRISQVELYYDIGCSNGYLTNIVAAQIGANRGIGWDIVTENLEVGRARYPDLEFRRLNLNSATDFCEPADFITCFETMEHVGNVHAALDNVVAMTKSSGGQAFFSVPIESGIRGAIKFLIKRGLFSYSLAEISQDPVIQRQYVRALFRGEDISCFRSQKDGWGTHFGFDHRNFEKLVKERFERTEAWTAFSTRFVWASK